MMSRPQRVVSVVAGFVLLACVWSPPPAAAVSLTVLNGELVGATDVQVGSLGLFDVEFVDGSCISLGLGCSAGESFTFTSQAEAVLASEALLNQVFVDGPAGFFDSNPILTRGISFIPPQSFDPELVAALILTPYLVTQYFNTYSNQFVDSVLSVAADNLGADLITPTVDDRVLVDLSFIFANYIPPILRPTDSLGAPDYYLRNNSVDFGVFARWNPVSAEPVPEPSTMLLLGSGLVGLASRARRRRQT